MSQPNDDWLGGLCACALIFLAMHLSQHEDCPAPHAERTDAMQATGMLFMSRATPQLTRDASGEPQLLLRTVHRASKHHTEAWTLFWRGQAAADFHAANAADLTAGQPLQVSVNNVRTHQVGPYLSEVHARVETCALVPRAQHTQEANT